MNYAKALKDSSPFLHEQDIKMYSSKMIAKQRYLNNLPISEEDRRVIIKHHLDKAKIKESRFKKVIFEKTKIKPFSLGRIETKNMILSKHHRESESNSKPKKTKKKKFELGPINHPSIVLTSPLNHKFDMSNFHRQLESLLIPENMVKEFDQTRASVNNNFISDTP